MKQHVKQIGSYYNFINSGLSEGSRKSKRAGAIPPLALPDATRTPTS